jgi:hypothetical protein
MAHRRAEKGSFGGQLDELIKVFPKEPPKGRKNGQSGDRSGEDLHVNDRLFESAWRKAREEDQSSGFSNQ